MGKRANNLSGMKFGKWTVIERAADKIQYDKSRPNGKPMAMWLCRCECGTVKVVSGSSLKRGKSLSCGCVSYKPANYKDLTGQRFGRLVVVEVEGARNSGEYKWLCRCDCGGEAIVLTSNLTRGNTKSCGCIRENRRAVPLDEYESEKRIKLSAVSDKWEYVRCYDRGKGKHIIKCVCCGAEKIVQRFYNIAECADCSREKERQLKELSKIKVCQQCGNTFKPIRSTALYCSEECSKRAYKERNRDSIREKQKIRKRLREANAKANGKIDYSITLAKLMERDNHTCKLCGRKVNENDYVFVGDAFIAGNDYPSIDHIKPLSKGGAHQWDNVQLAHRLCNSLKCDKEDLI